MERWLRYVSVDFRVPGLIDGKDPGHMPFPPPDAFVGFGPNTQSKPTVILLNELNANTCVSGRDAAENSESRALQRLWQR